MARRLLIGLALIAFAALAVSIYRFNAARDAGETLSGETRAEFVRSAVDGCLTRQKASPDNAGLDPKIVSSYCDCYAEALAGKITGPDLDRLRGQNPAEMQAAMRPKMLESEDACFAKLDDGK